MGLTVKKHFNMLTKRMRIIKDVTMMNKFHREIRTKVVIRMKRKKNGKMAILDSFFEMRMGWSYFST